jgi:hypothetical protein
MALRTLQEALPKAKPRRVDDEIHVDGDDALLPALGRALLQAGLPATSLRPLRETLERYFIEKTEGVMG